MPTLFVVLGLFLNKFWANQLMISTPHAAVAHLHIAYFLSIGLPPSEGGSHRRAGGGVEGERSDHRREGGGARPGGAGTHAGRETGTLSRSPPPSHKHTDSMSVIPISPKTNNV